MFTGLIQATGTIRDVAPRPEARRLTIGCDLAPERRAVGASVSVSGTCLTVVASRADEMELEAAFETLRRTTLGALAIGDRVNIEPSLRAGDPLDGHLVSGHVDGVGTVRSRSEHGDALELWIDLAADLLALVARKGSVAVDGVSLTVNEVDDRGFMVGLIPHTLAVTTLGELREGEAVNVEIDVIARYVARMLRRADLVAPGSGREAS